MLRDAVRNWKELTVPLVKAREVNFRKSEAE